MKLTGRNNDYNELSRIWGPLNKRLFQICHHSVPLSASVRAQQESQNVVCGSNHSEKRKCDRIGCNFTLMAAFDVPISSSNFHRFPVTVACSTLQISLKNNSFLIKFSENSKTSYESFTFCRFVWIPTFRPRILILELSMHDSELMCSESIL